MSAQCINVFACSPVLTLKQQLAGMGIQLAQQEHQVRDMATASGIASITHEQEVQELKAALKERKILVACLGNQLSLANTTHGQHEVVMLKPKHRLQCAEAHLATCGRPATETSKGDTARLPKITQPKGVKAVLGGKRRAMPGLDVNMSFTILRS